MKKSDIYFEHIEKYTLFSRFRSQLELAVMHKEVHRTFNILLFLIQNIGFQWKLANQAWPTFEVCID